MKETSTLPRGFLRGCTVDVGTGFTSPVPQEFLQGVTAAVVVPFAGKRAEPRAARVQIVDTTVAQGYRMCLKNEWGAWPRRLRVVRRRVGAERFSCREWSQIATNQ
jgi:hypothetical protein